jgi:Tfp pilus assembly protein PilZ
MPRRLRVPFDDLEAFRREFETHIARGGLFVPTLERFAPRELVEVQLELRFCAAEPVLEAEVVAQLRPAAGNLGGIALQLLEPTPALRARLAALTGLPVHPDRPSVQSAPAHRPQRSPARLRALLRADARAHETHTLDLSSTGALLPAGEEPLPVGERVRLALVHPGSGEQLELEARVVRHGVRDGRVEQIAVEFAPGAHGEVARRFIDESVAASHARSLGRVEGDLAAIDPMNLLQMLPASAQQGTLRLLAPEPGRIGTVLFRDGAIVFASLGRLRGRKALCRLIAWRAGRFEYAPEISAEAENEMAPLSLPGALLEALQHHDELGELDRSALPADVLLERRPVGGAPWSKLEGELLELLALPRPVADLVDAHPDYDVVIYRALLGLLDARAIARRPAPRPRA